MSKPNGRAEAHEKKIFCIGFNKTGTTSLHYFFKSVGLKSMHSPKWVGFSRKANGKAFFEDRQCYTDGERPDYNQLAEWFDGAIFILNTRNTKDWLVSRVKHVFRFEDVTEYNPKRHGSMARRFFEDPYKVIDGWHDTKLRYEAEVRGHYAGKENFIEVDVPGDPDFDKKLLNFLKTTAVVAPDAQIGKDIHKNKRPTSSAPNKDKVAEFRRYIDTCYESGKYSD